MRRKLQDLIYSNYPDLYAEKEDPLTETARCVGFQHSDGWFSIVDALSASLTAIEPNLRITGVEEKFGTLHVHTSGSSVAAMAAINVAESLSARICEVTGHPGELGLVGGWYSTRSPEIGSGQNEGNQSAQNFLARQSVGAGTADDGVEPPALPPLGKRLAFSRDEAIAALKRRHPRALANVKEFYIPPRLFDLVDVTLANMSGQRHDDPNGPVVRIDEIYWSAAEGLVFHASYVSLRPVALAAIERERKIAEKFGEQFTPPSLLDMSADILNEVMGAARFACEMALRMELQTGRCGDVDDTGAIIDRLPQNVGDAEDRLAPTRQVLALLGAFDSKDLTRPIVYARRSIKPTLEARRVVAKMLRDQSWRIVAPKLYAAPNFASWPTALPTAYHVAAGLAYQHRWRLILPVEFSRFLMGSAPRPDLGEIKNIYYDQPRESHCERVGLTLKPVPDQRLLNLNAAGQAIWHHIHQDNPPSKANLLKDARFAATAWFSNRALLKWLKEDVRAKRLRGDELFLGEAILAAANEPAPIAQEAPADFDPAAHEATAARVYDWQIQTGRDGLLYLSAGRLENHPHLAGSLATSTALVWYDKAIGWARTRSRYYRLMGK
jgi:hypothetical protein